MHFEITKSINHNHTGGFMNREKRSSFANNEIPDLSEVVLKENQNETKGKEIPEGKNKASAGKSRSRTQKENSSAADGMPTHRRVFGLNL